MSGDLIKVRLSGPAKVGGRWLKAADEEVTAEEFAALEAEGLIDLGYAKPVATEAAVAQTFTQVEFEDLVAKTARLLAEGLVDAAVSEVVKPLEARLAAIEEERDNLTELVASLRQVNDELSAQLSARVNPTPNAPGENAPEPTEVDMAQPQSGATSTDRNTPPSEKAAKTAPKKGAAATTKG